MSINKEIRELGDSIVRTHDGQMFFNLTEARKITSDSVNCIARKLHDNGITVKRRGKQKIVNAYQIAEYMCADRVSPIEGRQ